MPDTQNSLLRSLLERDSDRRRSKQSLWLRWTAGLVLALYCGLPVLASGPCNTDAGVPARDCSVLFIHSYHPGLEWAQILSQSFKDSLSVNPDVRIDTEFLDAKRYPELDHADAFVHLLREKYVSEPPQVLVISDDPAFDLIWPLRQELFPGVPVVFLGLNGIREGLLQGDRNATGIFEQHSTARTVELALELTGTTGIIVINDTSETGIANEIELGDLVKANPQVEWVIERDLSVNDLERLTVRPDDWPVITMLPLREDQPGRPMLSQRRSVELLRKSLPNPLFYDSEWMMGNGLVGGYMLSGADHARQAGELVLAVLGGASADSLPVRFDTKRQWIFDQRELDRFGWNKEQLPVDATVQYAREDFFQRNREVIYPMFWIMLVALVIIGLLSNTVGRQRRAEARLREQETRLTAALAATDAGVFEITQHGSYASSRWLTLLGLDSTAAEHDANQWLINASAESQRDFALALQRLESESDRETVELAVGDAHTRLVHVLITRSLDPAGFHTIIGVATDVSVTRQLEDEAARRNRLELLGELAGGIAHDFNNFLLVVRFSAQMAKDLDNVDEMRKLVTDIELSGEKTANVVKQLLAFGKSEPQSGTVIELAAAIEKTEPVLRRLLGMRCRLQVDINDRPLGVRIDQLQVERILSNLVVNAKDAMVAGGTIRLQAGIRQIEHCECVVLRVLDNGEGMDEATQARIFEPFYSTKAVDKGTGLGLSTVHSIVQSSGGTIRVCSALGAGSTFEMTWPREVVSEPLIDVPVQSAVEDEKTILLVEDDPRVGQMAQKILTKAGHEALLARNGSAGYEMFSSRSEDIDLVLSDVVLPKMNGIDMVAAIREIRPGVRVGFISGYADHPSLGGTQLPYDVQLLQKPFSSESLTEFVHRALEDPDHDYRVRA